MKAIDADALLQRWNNLLPRMARDKDGAVPIDFCLAIHEVSASPTLTLDDLRPKGRWDLDEKRRRYCTNCKKVAIQFENKAYYVPGFCYHCGADMRGGGEG